MNEFDIIKHYFDSHSLSRKEVIVGIGDDCAIVTVPHQQQLAITTDTLIEGVHFLKSTSPTDIGYKALAVNLSDLAAMGATPAWFTLALTLPHADQTWLEQFTQGMFELANHYHIELIGGDLTKAEQLTMSLSAYGFVDSKQFLKRDNAQLGDLICVSHTLGDAAFGFHILKNNRIVTDEQKNFFLQKLNRPKPQIELGKQLVNIAHACIDISDGLIADLSHILEMSSVGACVNVDKIPLSTYLQQTVTQDVAQELALTGGDDYELCLTIPHENIHLLPSSCTIIGEITREPGLSLLKNGKHYQISTKGYQHFS